MSVNIERKFLI